MSIGESALDTNESRTLDDKGTPDSGEGWTIFEKKDAKKHREHIDIAKTNEQKAIQVARSDRKLLKIEAKKKKRSEQKSASENQMNPEQFVQQSLVLVTLEEYMREEWFSMVEEEEDEKSFIYVR